MQTSKLIASEVDNWIDKHTRSSKMVARLDHVKNMSPKTQVPIIKAAVKNVEWASIFLLPTLIVMQWLVVIEKTQKLQ